MYKLVCSEMLTLLVVVSLVFLAAVGSNTNTLAAGASVFTSSSSSNSNSPRQSGPGDPSCREARIYENLITVGLTSDEGKIFETLENQQPSLKPVSLWSVLCVQK